MSARAKHVAQSSKILAPVVVFGIDANGKPKAARFGKDHATLATKAADQLQLRVLPGDHPRVVDLFGRLPVGRVHATGRTFVPFVRRDLYDKLAAIAAPNGNGDHSATPPTGSGAGGAAGSQPPGSKPNLPGTWSEIGLGDLVVGFHSDDEGWFEAVVVAQDGDMLTLRWHGYPRERKVVRHRNQVGLLCSGLRQQGEAAKASKGGAVRNRDQADKAQQPPSACSDIDINQLVLAKDHGPWLSWWEATLVEKVGADFKLRWHDGVNTSLITRTRGELAVIWADAE
jgi:hypothetical protein